jgi:hypothetical protein
MGWPEAVAISAGCLSGAAVFIAFMWAATR